MLKALARRWLVLVIFAALTALAVVTLPRAEGVYWSRVSVVFLAPVTTPNENALTEWTIAPDPKTLVNFAAVVERKLNGIDGSERYSAQSATLYGAGVRRGVNVTLVNSGGQWVRSYGDPVLMVDAVDTREAGVRETVQRTVERIEQVSIQAQVDAGVPANRLITTLHSPDTPVVNYSEGNLTRARAGIAALGALVGTSVALATDAALNALSRRRRAAA